MTPERPRARTRAPTPARLSSAASAGQRYQLLRPKPGQTVADAIAALRDDPDVRAIQRDFVLKPTAVPNDPLFGQQWGLRNLGLGINGAAAVAGDDIGVLGAWDHTVGIPPSTVVADIDSGYRPELSGTPRRTPLVDDARLGLRRHTRLPRRDPTDDDLVDGGHGIHTAGIIGAVRQQLDRHQRRRPERPHHAAARLRLTPGLPATSTASLRRSTSPDNTARASRTCRSAARDVAHDRPGHGPVSRNAVRDRGRQRGPRLR